MESEEVVTSRILVFLIAVACLGQAESAISLESPAVVGMPVWLKVPASDPIVDHV